MTTDRSEKKVLMLAVYCAAIVLGVYMMFFHNPNEENESKQETEAYETEQTDGQAGETMQDKGTNYVNMELPDIENEAADELYSGEGIADVCVYFSNTEQLDNGNLPLEVQAVLVQEVQDFLNENGYGDVTELYIDDESYEEDENRTVFLCFMDGYKEVLQVAYLPAEKELVFHILQDRQM